MTVEKRTETVAAMVAAAAKGRALMGGSGAMRTAGEMYLPKFKAEDPLDYTARLTASWLFNGFRKSVHDMTGRVFDKPVEVAEGPNQLIEWAENIDMQGRDLSTFASEVFKDGFASGVSYIMADAPKRNGETTRAQASAAGLRPYLVHLKVEEVLGWKTETYGNVLAFSQFRILEQATQARADDEFAEDAIGQVRVLDRTDTGVNVRIYREEKDAWYLFDEYTTDAQEITVIPYYARRTGFATGEPVLDDLADVNIAHWQSQSDQRNILHFARVPILHAAGRNSDDGPLTISASQAVSSGDYQAKLEWVEHSGQAIGAGRQDLKDLEFQMETLGLQLLVQSAQTATGAALDAAKETSGLAMMADSLKDALEQALAWAADYGGLGEQSITLSVNKEFGVSMMTAQEVAALLSAVNTGNISRETLIEEMKRRGVLRPDLDTQEEMDRIDTEGPDLGLTDGGF